MFIKGHCILDNIITDEELLFSMPKRRLPRYFIKVDFAKASNMVDWDFLIELLEAYDFGNRWIIWVRSILFTFKANFLINGSHKGYA